MKINLPGSLLVHVSGYLLSYLSATQLVIGPGRARDSTGVQDIIDATGFTVSLAASGPNGLDTGSIAANTIYFVYVCEGSSGRCGLLSLSSTTPSLPAGYNQYRRRVGAIKTNASSQLVIFLSFAAGSLRYYIWANSITARTVLSGGSATTPTNVSFAAWQPSTASWIALLVRNNSSARIGQLWDPTQTQIVININPESSEYASIVPAVGQDIAYSNNGAGGSLDFVVGGWMEVL